MHPAISKLIREPVLRLGARAVLPLLRPSWQTRALWDISDRPQYLLGMAAAVELAKRQGATAFSAIEFGVAGGTGLCAMQADAEMLERETGIRIKVYGFDTAGGLPEFIGDHRDHPDLWQPGDYPMDFDKLRQRLTSRTELVLGNVRDTVHSFFDRYSPPPLGFISFDLDLYSSTKAALEIFDAPSRSMLLHVPCYFDDIGFIANYRYAGEFLAIDEFNERSAGVKLDRWHGVKYGRPFPERPFLEQMYVAHDIAALSAIGAQASRARAQLPLQA